MYITSNDKNPKYFLQFGTNQNVSLMTKSLYFTIGCNIEQKLGEMFYILVRCLTEPWMVLRRNRQLTIISTNSQLTVVKVRDEMSCRVSNQGPLAVLQHFGVICYTPYSMVIAN